MNITNYKLKRFTKSNGKNSLSIIMAYQTYMLEHSDQLTEAN